MRRAVARTTSLMNRLGSVWHVLVSPFTLPYRPMSWPTWPNRILFSLRVLPNYPPPRLKRPRVIAFSHNGQIYRRTSHISSVSTPKPWCCPTRRRPITCAISQRNLLFTHPRSCPRKWGRPMSCHERISPLLRLTPNLPPLSLLLSGCGWAER